MDTITGTAHAHGVAVEVFPGGALATIALSREAMRLGTRGLAAAVLGVVAEATAAANQRTRHALRDTFGDRQLIALGLESPAELTERVESTTPQSWRV